MKAKSILTASALMLGQLACTASAQGLSSTSPDWTGAYAGVGVPFPVSESSWEGDAAMGKSQPDRWSGDVAMLKAGYSWQRDNFVYGLELSTVLGATAATSPSDGIWQCSLGGGCTTEIKRLTELKARVGYAAGKALVYGTFGLANAKARLEFGGASSDETVSGWSIGLGAEYFVAPRASVFGEVTHADLGRAQSTVVFCNVVPCYTDVDITSVITGVNFRW